jgi:hypothetical protein
MYKYRKYYNVNGKKMKFLGYISCEIDNGEEICACCHGKAVFSYNNFLEKKCGFKYIMLGNYKDAYEEYMDDL